MKARWAILIASSLERHPLLEDLLDDLHEQTRPYKDVNVIALTDDCKMPLDQKRNLLVSMANAEYISFIDDDDRVASDYVSTIYPLLDGANYVGFQLQHYHKGEPSKPTYHSLQYENWSEDEKGYYRNISHLNPIRTRIAERFSFIGNYGEDFSWAQQVAKSGLVKTEHYIPRVMYHYYFNPDKSLTIGR